MRDPFNTYRTSETDRLVASFPVCDDVKLLKLPFHQYKPTMINYNFKEVDN
jgi:hypothetical protein